MTESTAPGALSRFRVIDLTQVRAGPTCVKQLADFGADVIRVEPPPGGPREAVATGERDGADMQNLHRNKRSLTLNLKTAEGRTILGKLVETADVVVENYRPDVKYRLGLDYESLAAINPRVVLASISGFGQDGPYRDRPGFDQIAQGMSGMMSVTGKPGDGPLRAGAAVDDICAGLYAALGVLTALLEREVSGRGQWVQSSLLHAGIALLDFQAARYLIGGEVPRQVGNDHPTSMPTSAYPTADGHINVAAAGQPMWGKLCDAIGRGDLLEREEFATPPGRSRNRGALNAELARTFATAPSEEWIERLNAAGVPCGPILGMDAVFADPQVRHLGVAAPVTHPTLGEIQVIRQAATLSRTPARLTSALGAPGAHNEEILGEIGYSAQDVARLRAEGVV